MRSNFISNHSKAKFCGEKEFSLSVVLFDAFNTIREKETHLFAIFHNGLKSFLDLMREFHNNINSMRYTSYISIYKQ